MTISRRFSVSMIAFLIGLGSSPMHAQATTAADDDRSEYTSIDQWIDRDFSQGKGGNFIARSENMQYQQPLTRPVPIRAAVDERFRNGPPDSSEQNRTPHSNYSNNNNGNPPNTETASLEQDPGAYYVSGFHPDGTSDNAGQNERNRHDHGGRHFDGSDYHAVQQDRVALKQDIEQTRADRQDDNTSALLQDEANDQTARANLKEANATLRQDRSEFITTNRQNQNTVQQNTVQGVQQSNAATAPSEASSVPRPVNGSPAQIKLAGTLPNPATLAAQSQPNETVAANISAGGTVPAASRSASNINMVPGSAHKTGPAPHVAPIHPVAMMHAAGRR